MTPERWQQVKAILADALECVSPAERHALVEQACAADVQLREEVEALLAFDDCVATIV
jgi:energy-converting hydrogenase A subunit M